MTSQDQQKEIEHSEAWFRSACHDEHAPDIDRIKRAARLAINERWLAGELYEPSDHALAIETKSRVRLMLDGSDHHKDELVSGVHSEDSSSQTIRFPNRRWLTVASLAAAACFVVAILFEREESPEPDTLFVADFEQFEEDTLSSSIASLDQDLADLESAWNDDESMADASDYLDDLIDDLDTKFYEAQEYNDWAQTIFEGTTQ